MFTADEIEIELLEADGPVALVRIATPVGTIDLIGEITFRDRSMLISAAHIDGPGAGTVGRAGLNAIGAKLLLVADVESFVVQGGTRTTGRNAGRPPGAFRYPR